MTELMQKISKQSIRNTIVILHTVLSFVFLFKLMTLEIPDGNRDTVNTLAGIIIGQLVTTYAFYFGQSKSEVDEKKKENENN